MKYKAKIINDELKVVAKKTLQETIVQDQINELQRLNYSSFLKIKEVNQKKIEYTGPSCMSLEYYSKKPISAVKFYQLMIHLTCIIGYTEQAGLIMSNLVMNPANIYVVDKENIFKIFFIYEPVDVVRPATDFKKALLDICRIMTPQDASHKRAIDGVIETLEGQAFYDGMAVINHIKQKEPGILKWMKGRPGGDSVSGFLQVEFSDRTGTTAGTTAKTAEEQSTAALPSTLEQTASLDDATTILSNEPRVYIKQERTGNKVAITGFPFTIGKKNCNYNIEGNPTVSRTHAQIQKSVNGYELKDLNSTNGIVIDGILLGKGEKGILRDGMLFEISDEKFVFLVEI